MHIAGEESKKQLERHRILLFKGIEDKIDKLDSNTIINIANSLEIPMELFITTSFNVFINFADYKKELKINTDNWAHFINKIDIYKYLFYSFPTDNLVELLPKIKDIKNKYIIITTINYSKYRINRLNKELEDDIFISILKELISIWKNKLNEHIAFRITKLFGLKKTLNYEKGLDFLNELRKRKLGRTFPIRMNLIRFLIQSAKNDEEKKAIMKGEKSSYCISGFNYYSQGEK